MYLPHQGTGTEPERRDTMYGFHPDTVHEAAVVEAARLREQTERRGRRRVPLRTRHWFSTFLVG